MVSEDYTFAVCVHGGFDVVIQHRILGAVGISEQDIVDIGNLGRGQRWEGHVSSLIKYGDKENEKVRITVMRVS